MVQYTSGVVRWELETSEHVKPLTLTLEVISCRDGQWVKLHLPLLEDQHSVSSIGYL